MKRASITFAAATIALLALGCRSPVGGKDGEAASSAKSITAFSFASPLATGTIDEANLTIAVSVPFGTILTSLVPTIAVSEGARVSPESGTAHDFTRPAAYAVTAADGSTQSYTVTVTAAPNPANLITSFIFTDPPAAGVIDEAARAIRVIVPYGTDVTSLAPTIAASEGASVSPESGAARDFTHPAAYTVTAASGATREYTVTVDVAGLTTKSITAFSFADPPATGTIDEANRAIAVSVPYGTILTALVPTISHSGSSVSPASGVAQDFTHDVAYTVTAADSSSQEYLVTVTALPASAACDITAFSIDGVNGTIAGSAISLSLPMGTDPKHLVAAFALSAKAAAEAGGAAQTSGVTGNDFTNALTYRVTAEDGEHYRDYQVTASITAMPGQAWTTIDGGGTYGISSTSSANSQYASLAVLDDKLYAAWVEMDSLIAQVHIKSYDGSSWSAAGNSPGSSQLSTSTTGGYSPYPKLAAFNGALYAAWSEYEAEIMTVHVKKFDGSSWTFVQSYALGDGRTDIHYAITAHAWKPDLFVFNGALYAAWLEQANVTGINQVRVSRFDGSLWTSADGNGPYGINYDTAKHATWPVFGEFGNDLYLAWAETGPGGISQFRAKRYDGGGTWTFVDGGAATGLNYSTTTQPTDYPVSLTSNESGLFYFWTEDNRIHAKQYDGSSWSNLLDDGASGWNYNNTLGGYYPFGYRYNDLVFVAWEQNPIPRKLHVTLFDGTAKTYLDGDVAVGINNASTNRAHFPKLAEYAGNMVSVWSEELTSTQGSANQIRAKSYVLPPIVKTVGVPAGGPYTTGQTLGFTVNFSKNVSIASGTPYLPIVLDSGIRNAAYVSGDGTRSFVFSYTIGAGDSDSDGIALGNAVAGAVLRSQDANPLPANYFLYGVPSATAITVN